MVASSAGHASASGHAKQDETSPCLAVQSPHAGNVLSTDIVAMTVAPNRKVQ
jgi:hypothetical protein